MGSTNNVKIQEIFRMEKPEFLSFAIRRYLENSLSEEVSADELKIMIEWSEKTRTDALFLEQLFQGYMIPSIADGEVEFF